MGDVLAVAEGVTDSVGDTEARALVEPDTVGVGDRVRVMDTLEVAEGSAVGVSVGVGDGTAVWVSLMVGDWVVTGVLVVEAVWEGVPLMVEDRLVEEVGVGVGEGVPLSPPPHTHPRTTLQEKTSCG